MGSWYFDFCIMLGVSWVLGRTSTDEASLGDSYWFWFLSIKGGEPISCSTSVEQAMQQQLHIIKGGSHFSKGGLVKLDINQY